MKCQISFLGKNKKKANLLSAELAQRVLKVKDSKHPDTAFPSFYGKRLIL